MNTIRKLEHHDFLNFVKLMATAYPGVIPATEEGHKDFAEQFIERQSTDPTKHFYGVYRENCLVGGMLLHDFTLNLLSMPVAIGGIGMVATDFLHKKEKIARDILTFFLDHYRVRGCPMVALYPFRPDFYRRMGFGYGAKTSLYRFRPEELLPVSPKPKVRWLTKTNAPAILACHNRYFARTHGMIERTMPMLYRTMKEPENRIVGYEEDGQLLGYIIFRFRKQPELSFLTYDLEVMELIYETPAALSALLTFLHSQNDQVRHIIFPTQDESFHFLLRDPRNTQAVHQPSCHETNLQGIGIMYRVIDLLQTFRLLSRHNFGSQTCKLRIQLKDSFFPVNESDLIVDFQNGYPRIAEGDNFDVSISLSVEDFSSLLMGTVSFHTLCHYRLAEISDSDWIDTVTRLFLTLEKPVCTARF